MGLTLNPISYRVGFSRSWSDACFVHRIYYSVFLYKLISIKLLIEYIVLKFFPGYWSEWIFSHCNIVNDNGYIHVNIFIYDGSEIQRYRQSAAFLIKRFFRKLILAKYWSKNYLVNWNRKAQKLFLLLQFLGVTVDRRPLEDLTITLSKRKQARIKYLKEKKGHRWKAREELVALKELAEIIGSKGYGKIVVKWLPIYYWRLFHRKTSWEIVEAYRRVFFCFAFIDYLFRSFNYNYPAKNWRFYILVYVVKIFDLIGRKRPFFLKVAVFLQWLLLYLDVAKSKINFFFLDNTCLTADFIAKYIALSIQKGYYYQHVYKPIRKALNQQLRTSFLGKLKKLKRDIAEKITESFNDKQYFLRSKSAFFAFIFLFDKIFQRFFFNVFFVRFKIILKREKFYFNKRMNKVTKLRDISYKWKKKLKHRKFIRPFFKIFRFSKTFFASKVYYSFYKFKNKLIKASFFFKVKTFFFKRFTIFGLKLFWFLRFLIWKKIRSTKKFLHKLKKRFLFMSAIFFFKIKSRCLKLARFFFNNQETIFFFKSLINCIYFSLTKFRKLNKKFIKHKYSVNMFLVNYIKSFNINVIYCFCRNFMQKMPVYKLSKNLYNSVNLIKPKKQIKPIQKLKESPLRSKNTSISYLSNNNEILLGYKFQFVGRFTRKQMAANMWFSKGSLYKATRNIDLDYGFQTVTLQFSACSVKIWLAKSLRYPTYVFKLI